MTNIHNEKVPYSCVGISQQVSVQVLVFDVITAIDCALSPLAGQSSMVQRTSGAPCATLVRWTTDTVYHDG